MRTWASRRSQRGRTYWIGSRARLPTSDRSSPTCPVGGAAKRVVDVALATSCLLLFLPLFALVAAAIIGLDGRPFIYRHPRIGHGCRRFYCLKFRTMAANSDEILARHLVAFPEAAREWAETRKLKNDPRITALGAVLRKTSLDELPQLINVIRGDMSLVGPRPIVSDEVQMYGSDAHYYFLARPGLTGAWQVSGRNDQSYERRVALDRDYVENWHLHKDLRIIIRTLPVVFLAKGSY
jgi:exopolysaccharide production protein ExoY